MKRTPLTRSRKPMKRSRLSPVGARKRRQAEEHRLWKAKCLGAAGGRCEYCGVGLRGGGDPHHIFGKGAYPALRFVDVNGIALCRGCHSEQAHGRPAEFLRWFTKHHPARWAALVQEKETYNDR